MAGKADVVGIGSCTVDYFAIVPRLLGAEEKINAERMEIHAGGVTANNLTQVARLGASTGWLGLIGDDENGRIIQKAFTDDGMDLSGIEVVKGEHSSLTWIPVDGAGERCIYMFPNVTGKISVFQVLNRFAPHIRAAKHFHTEASQLPIAPVKETMRVAKEAGVRVLFDLDVSPSFFAAANLGTQEELCPALKLVDVLKPCKTAARELTGESDYEKIAVELLKLGPKIVAITMGADGCLIASGDQKVHVPAFKPEVVDTTGAGDAFMGGLSYALLQGLDLRRVGIFANACAALCTTRVGARAMAKHDEVVAFVKAQSPAEAAAF
ncbi:MAG TPA: carbohydrate kinase family protein [Candidatus Limnocylindrales bacterium]|nr:carbohydrate kinase family protein [Candidatus Limnocylindrales bacterium]